MNKIPLPADLPWEMQLMFWVLFILVGIGFGLTIWFLIRHVNGQDKINLDTLDKFKEINRKIEEVRVNQQSQADRAIREIQEVQKSALGVRRETLEDIAQIKDDVRETKSLTKAVETHHTVLKTIIVKLNDLMIIKSKKD